MGMYDYIRCERPLPNDPPPPSGVEWFQTKSFQPSWMEKYAIRADGHLVKFGVRYEDRSDKSKTGLAGLMGMMTPIDVPEEDAEIAFHGDVNFGHYDYKTSTYWNYIARFTEGVCTKIWCDEYSVSETQP